MGQFKTVLKWLKFKKSCIFHGFYWLPNKEGGIQNLAKKIKKGKLGEKYAGRTH